MQFRLRTIFWLVTVAGFGCWLFSFSPVGVPEVENQTGRVPGAFEMMDLLAVVAADRAARILICVLVFFLPNIVVWLRKRWQPAFVTAKPHPH